MTATEKRQCSERVYRSRGIMGDMIQCQKPAIVERGGKWYCKIHDPKYIIARSKAKSDKWAAERKAREVVYALEDERDRVTNGLTTEELKALTPAKLHACNDLIGLLRRIKEHAPYLNRIALVEEIDKALAQAKEGK